MLSRLYIKNFLTINQIELDFFSGLTVITGTTGAGKSILLDALGLVTGDRANPDCVRNECDKAEISAVFTLTDDSPSAHWLKNNDLYENNECILRRVVMKGERSRAYINGRASTLADLRTLGSFLIDIHGQHEAQSLLQKSQHGHILDNFLDEKELIISVQHLSQRYHRIQAELTEKRDLEAEQHERMQLVEYQLHELQSLNLQAQEVEQLENQVRQMDKSESILTACQQVMDLCSDNRSGYVLQYLNQSINSLDKLDIAIAQLDNIKGMLNSARIQIEEAMTDLIEFQDQFDIDPEVKKLANERLSVIYDIARKHRVAIDELLEKQKKLEDELRLLQLSSEQSHKLEQELDKIKSEYYVVTDRLSKIRKKVATQLEKKVTQRIKMLGMPNGQFVIQLVELDKTELSVHGNEMVTFLVSTNPDQPARSLIKVASGGELSRISLAIQVIITGTLNTTSLVFDEVDVGIGGETAEIVGNMLKELGLKNQVICVTHQPQVASKGDQHLYVDKHVTDKKTETYVATLHNDQRINEIARMLGGIKITPQTLNHAKEMLSWVEDS